MLATLTGRVVQAQRGEHRDGVRGHSAQQVQLGDVCARVLAVLNQSQSSTGGHEPIIIEEAVSSHPRGLSFSVLSLCYGQDRSLRGHTSAAAVCKSGLS